MTSAQMLSRRLSHSSIGPSSPTIPSTSMEMPESRRSSFSGDFPTLARRRSETSLIMDTRGHGASFLMHEEKQRLVDELHKEKERLALALKDGDSKKIEIEDAENKIKYLEEELNRYKSIKSDLKKTKKDLEISEQGREDDRSRSAYNARFYASIEKEKEIQRDNSYNMMKFSLEDRISVLRHENIQINLQFKPLKAENDQLKSQLKETRENLSVCKSELEQQKEAQVIDKDSDEKTISRLEKKISNLQNNIKVISVKNKEQNCPECKELLKNIAIYKKQIEALESKLKKTNEQISFSIKENQSIIKKSKESENIPKKKLEDVITAFEKNAEELRENLSYVSLQNVKNIKPYEYILSNLKKIKEKSEQEDFPGQCDKLLNNAILCSESSIKVLHDSIKSNFYLRSAFDVNEEYEQ